MKLSTLVRTAFVGGLSFLLTSCLAYDVAMMVPVQRKQVFNEADFHGMDRAGTGTIVGHAYATMRDNVTQHAAANCEVETIPVNAYSTEVMHVGFELNRNLTKGDPRAKKYVRTVMSASDGTFVMRGLPAGQYYVGTTVSWKEDWYNGEEWDYIHYSVPIYSQVTVREGQTTKVSYWQYGRQVSR